MAATTSLVVGCHWPISFDSSLGSSLPRLQLAPNFAQRSRLVCPSEVFRVNRGTVQGCVRARAEFSGFGSVGVSSDVMAQKRGNKLKPDLHLQVFDDPAELSKGLAEYIEKLSAAVIEERGAFSLVLSGGSLVGALGKLTESPSLERIDWSRFHVYWVDERVVKKDDPDSSYKLAHDLFLTKVAIPIGQVYSINDALDAQGAAEEYETVIRQHTRTGIVAVSEQGLPKFDLMLLGMGPDGHVASLFPNHSLVEERSKWVAAITDSPKPPPQRITFTFPVINSAANVAFVANGSSKADMLKRVFGEELPAGELPAQMVFPTNGKLVWFVDRAAAASIAT